MDFHGVCFDRGMQVDILFLLLKLSDPLNHGDVFGQQVCQR